MIHKLVSHHILAWCFPVLFLSLTFTLAQTPASRSTAVKPLGPDGNARTQVEDYSVGPQDVLSVTIQNMPEASGKFRVTDRGYVVLPGLASPIEASGLTPLELSRRVAQALKNAELLRDPVVSITVEEYHSQTVTVLGAVQKPAVYPLEKPTTVLEMLSIAGGLLPTAGRNVTLVRMNSTVSARPGNGARPEDQTILNFDLAKLLEGKNSALNVTMRAGDVLTVNAAPLIYVVGAVQKPGGFVIQDPASGVTVLQALALAEGITPVAAAHRSMIVRHASSGSDRQEIAIDVTKLMAGKIEDRILEPNDILFIPESGTKRSARRLGEAAVQAATGVIIYGVGYGMVRP